MDWIQEGNWQPWDENRSGSLPYGWAGEYAFPNKTNFEDHFQMYIDMVAWMYKNIDNTKANAHWDKISDCIYVQIRKPTDAILFRLRWQ